MGSEVQWYYIDKTKKNEPIAYNQTVNTLIEKAFQDNMAGLAIVGYLDVRHNIVFRDMVANIEGGYPYRYQLVRRDQDKVAAECDFPSYWEEISTSENLKMFTVNAESPEYGRVSAKFGPTKNRIIKIERIQNKTLYRQYQAKKKLFNERLSNTQPYERELWHGTATEAFSININGFNRSYCGNNDVLGHGVYFAVAPGYHYSGPDAMGYNYSYLVDVLTGEYAQEAEGMRVPPPIDAAVPSVLYDSVVNNPSEIKVFVIFNDSQAYPKYLITFE